MEISLFIEGNRLLFSNNYVEAIKCFDDAIKINPNYLDSYINKAIALINYKNMMKLF